MYSGLKGDDRHLDEAIKGFQSDLADGNLNTAGDFTAWIDRLIFREEQRVIGASMIYDNDRRVVLGYGDFRGASKRADDDQELWWPRIVRRFLMVDAAQLNALAAIKDFRLERFKRMVAHLEICTSLLQSSAPAPGKSEGRGNEKTSAGLLMDDRTAGAT